MSQLKAEALCKHFAERQVVRNVSLNVSEGEVVGLLGPNGAGKTTTFHMLVGLQKPTSGKVFLDDRNISLYPLYKRARIGISYLPQESSVFRQLSAKDNLKIILEHTGISRNEQEKQANKLLEEFHISHIANTLAGHLSGGERRRLEVARALIRSPKFILLDEPFAGIDPLAIDDLQILIRNLQTRNIGVLISDHNVRETLRICDRAYLMYEGQVILNGTPDYIVNDEKAKRVYLGESFSL
ncbi:LPS export ABC transporter ATP-binding protein [Desulfovibrio litoralis]|uniref:Lipopolysaccharide export system ATP-binding protein n=1 Tax=Desulfovibrio litoralis DSM 11393 TaxID=1121455 RepID=A0A1M7T1P2_9BACT|nr:LPS export ABC transporter ATP-binding protein [Desulfovibrio litoralis]SHN64572.1 lipopolysaccharide export system ATP-binding protein [Desulfovibrio litoralis DSM 11393]